MQKPIFTFLAITPEGIIWLFFISKMLNSVLELVSLSLCSCAAESICLLLVEISEADGKFSFSRTQTVIETIHLYL